jgi:two-component system chemotaxis response regulator CheY
MEFRPDMPVLVVDDHAAMRMLLKRMMLKLGLTNTLDAEDGEKALDIITGGDIGLVISDWNMPFMSGIELLRRVRAREALSGLPFLMVTCEALEANVLEAASAGVSAYVVKPFSEQTLARKIEYLFGLRPKTLPLGGVEEAKPKR